MGLLSGYVLMMFPRLKQLVAIESWNTNYSWVKWFFSFIRFATSVKATKLNERARAPKQMLIPIPFTARIPLSHLLLSLLINIITDSIRLYLHTYEGKNQYFLMESKIFSTSYRCLHFCPTAKGHFRWILRIRRK